MGAETITKKMRDATSELLREVASLRNRLEEAEETLRSIRNDEVDALVISGVQGDQVFTLQTAERPYRVLIEGMQEGALTLSTEGTILYSNQGFARILHKPLESIVGASILSFVAEDYLPTMESILRECLTGGSKGEIQLLSDSGTAVPVYISATHLPEDRSHPISLIITDLAEQKRNEQIIADEKLARAILDYATVSIVVCDTDGTIIRANRAAHHLAGINVLQRAFVEAFPLDVDFLLLTNSSAVGVTQTGIEAELIRQDDRQFYLLISAGPLRSVQGSTLGYVVTLLDITQRKRDETALRERQLDIETLNVRLQRSMSETHHRVKNNLQVITALVNLQLLDNAETVPVSELQRLNQHIKSLATIHDLLTFHAKNDLSLTDISVQEVMDKFLPTVEEMMMERRPFKSCIEDLRMPVRKVTTFAVIVNELISNAVKHGRGTISIHLQTVNSNAQLIVTDEGSGFPADFDPAVAASTGLELLQSLTAWDLQGAIHFGNTPEGGAKVTIEFPIPGVPARTERAQ